MPDVRVRVDVVDRGREVETPVGHQQDSTDRLPSAIAAAVAEVADQLDVEGVEWLLAGGAGRALLGASAAPGDVDIEVRGGDLARAARRLEATPALSSDERMRSARASAVVRATPVDISADVTVVAPSPLASDFALQREWATSTSVHARAVLVAPEEELLLRAAAAGDHRRVRRLGASAMGRGRREGYVLRRLARASAAS